MADLTRIQNSQPVQLVDATDYLVCDISTIAPTGTENGLIVRNIPSGTQAISGTITATPSGTYTVAGTVTAVPTGTQAVSGTITASPTGTYTVAGSTTAIPSGTYTVSGTVSTNADAAVTAGSAPTKALIGGLIYNSTAPTLTNGQSVALQADANGNLQVVTKAVAVSSTNALSQVTVSNSVSTTLLSSNSNRKYFQIYNNSSNYIYVKFGATASSTSYSFIMYSNGLYESDRWTGQVDAIANSASSVINITEF